MKDARDVAIVVLIATVVILVFVGGFLFFGNKMRDARESSYVQGVQDGRLLEQRNIINGILANGFYAVPVIDEQNKTQQVLLGMVSPSGSEAGMGQTNTKKR